MSSGLWCSMLASAQTTLASSWGLNSSTLDTTCTQAARGAWHGCVSTLGWLVQQHLLLRLPADTVGRTDNQVSGC